MWNLAQVEALFTAPALAAAGAVAMGVPVAIHLLSRVRRQREPWAAMQFLLEAYKRQRYRVQLEQLLLLLLRCLILLVLGFALAGPLLGGIFSQLGIDTEGRVICIVVDDALSSRSLEADTQRFETLRKQALAALDGAKPGDRVGLWFTANPVRTAVVPPTDQLADVRRALESAEPRYSRADWSTTLRSVSAALAEANRGQDRSFVMIVSDFAMGTMDDQQSMPAELSGIGDRAQLLVTRPLASLPNTQIARVSLRRSVVLADPGTAPTASTQITLRRFAGEAGPGVTGVTVSVYTLGGSEPISTVKREFRWSSGQTSAAINIEAPLTDGTTTAPLDSASAMVLRASIDEDRNQNALLDDDERWAVVELRRNLAVGIVDAGAGTAADDFLRPVDWLKLALQPRTRMLAWDPIVLSDVPPADVTPARLQNLDALMVLRPDALTDDDWRHTRAAVDEGMVLWLFAPPMDASAVWATRLRDAMDVDWQVGLDAVAYESAEAEGEASDASIAARDGWSLTTDRAVPERLRLLGADWVYLLRPVVVRKRLPLQVRETERRWLEINDGQDNALMAVAPVGQGHVILLSTALDLQWTNLPAKPLFVPLMHETLRGMLSNETGDENREVIAGDMPALGRQWSNVTGLVGSVGPAAKQQAPVSISLESRQAATSIDLPGTYAPSTDNGRRLAVNVSAPAGDTAAISETMLGQWLRPLGEWRWLDTLDPAAMLAEPPKRANIGWPLLWVLLALLLLETWLARVFSHAAAPRRKRQWARRLTQFVKGVRE
jgi:hypothetical protein